MAIMLSEVYDALMEAGASEGKARAVAEQVASHNSRLLRLEVMTALILTLVVAIFVMVINLSIKACLIEVRISNRLGSPVYTCETWGVLRI